MALFGRETPEEQARAEAWGQWARDRNPYALASAAERSVVTTEVSRPSRQRQNRKIPDVCSAVGVQCCGPFTLNRNLGFRTGWRAGV